MKRIFRLYTLHNAFLYPRDYEGFYHIENVTQCTSSLPLFLLKISGVWNTCLSSMGPEMAMNLFKRGEGGNKNARSNGLKR